MRIISRFRRFHEDFSLKDGPCAPPSIFYTRAWHNLRKALGEGLGLLCALFTSLSLYPFHLSIPLYPSLPLSIPLSLSFSPSQSLSLLSLPPSLYLSFYLSFSLFPSLSLLFIILFGVSNGRFRPCFKYQDINFLRYKWLFYIRNLKYAPFNTIFRLHNNHLVFTTCKHKYKLILCIENRF